MRLAHSLPGEPKDPLEDDAGEVAQVVAQALERQLAAF